MHQDRLANIVALQTARKSAIICYVTSDRQGLETQLAEDVLSIFSDHLDAIEDVEKISLFLYTRGGSTMAAWSIVNLIRSFCKELEVIVPSKCHSAGTIICLGANTVMMTKQATLGPIDPSTNGLFNPFVELNGQKIKAPVSVEQVNSFINLIKEELNIVDQVSLSNIVITLCNHIHPIALGEVFRSKNQIQMIAKKLLKKQGIDNEEQIEQIIKFLVSESGSHDYTIHRKEAHEELRLNIAKPTDEEYQLIKAIFKDIESEMELNSPYNPVTYIGADPHKTYSFRRSLVESEKGGCHAFLSEGTLNLQQTPAGTLLNDTRSFEAWRKL